MKKLSALMAAAVLSAAFAAPVLAQSAKVTDGRVVVAAQHGKQGGRLVGQSAAQTGDAMSSSADGMNWMAGGGG